MLPPVTTVLLIRYVDLLYKLRLKGCFKESCEMGNDMEEMSRGVSQPSNHSIR